MFGLRLWGTNRRKGVTVEVSSADRVRLGGDCRGSEQRAEVRVARPHRADDGRRRRDQRDYAANRQELGHRVALAGAFHGARGRRSGARQDPLVAHPALPAVVRAQTVAKTLSDPPAETIHRDGGDDGRAGRDQRQLAPRIWRARLQPHRAHQLKLSPERKFVEKLRDRPFSIDPWRAIGLIFG
jgi:hypothetical protein